MPDQVTTFLRTLAQAEDCSGTSNWPAAIPLWEKVVQTNPVNGNYWSPLAKAQFELKDYASAAISYEKALQLGVQRPSIPSETPGELCYQMACCHAGLRDEERAIDALQRALDKGFRSLEKARTDERWQFVLTNQRVRDLLGIFDTSDLSRADGWRTDLRFMLREVKRRAYAPFAEISEADFDRQAAELEDLIPTLSDAQIIIGMTKLIRHFGDGHAFVAPAKSDRELHYALPLDFFVFTEGIFVIAAAPEYDSLVGARVEKIGARPIADVLVALDPVICRDNDQWVRHVTPDWLRRTPMLHGLGLIEEPDRAILTVRLPDGSQEQVVVDAAPTDRRRSTPYPEEWIALIDELAVEPPLHLRNRALPYWFDYLPADNLVYFQFNDVRDNSVESFAAFCNRLFDFIEARRPGRLVIDLRWNGGGNTFLARNLVRRLVGCPMVNRRGSLFVVIGRLTFSAAQNTATFLESETEAVFVGEPTGSRPNFIGETIPFELPYSHVQVNVSDLYWQTSWPDDHRVWIAPQIYTPATFEAFSKNQDPAMEAILAYREYLPGA